METVSAEDLNRSRAIEHFERNVEINKARFAREPHLKAVIVTPYRIWGEHFAKRLVCDRSRLAFVTSVFEGSRLEGLHSNHPIFLVESSRIREDSASWRQTEAYLFQVARRRGLVVLRVNLP